MHESEVRIRKTCLNGWWDFQPGTGSSVSSVPREGWEIGAYLVPSMWRKPADAVRRPGEIYFRPKSHTDKCVDPHAEPLSPDDEFLFDAYRYPFAWTLTREGWARRSLSLEQKPEGRRFFLLFEAVMPTSTIFLNGKAVASHLHPTLPIEVDVTDSLQEGENEIAVLIQDYPRDAKGRHMVPTGNWIPTGNCGIWQDVWLIERGEIYVSDVTIRTSTRNSTLTLRFEVMNASPESRTVTVKSEVADWNRNEDPLHAHPVLVIPSFTLSIPAGGCVYHELTIPWKDAIWWYPERPKLYWLRTRLVEKHIPIEVTWERFGFREVWIEGPDLMLNDYPVHLFSDWGHKLTPYHQTESWIRQWFGMIRDGNMNHSRLHTSPSTPLTFDLADEEGILITAETGIHGSAGAQASDEPVYWQNARDHIRRLVRRDKNHPSIILWSVENEMRWNGNATSLCEEELPKLRKLFYELDPTRPAYHEGDSSLWNESTQEIYSRHYGKECSGLGWWKRDKPLHAGEMASYHYMGPNNTLHLGGEAVYADYRKLEEAAAREAALIIEAGRTLGVCCFGPWNLSCLVNLRMTDAPVTLTYDDMTSPGVKPLYVPPHSSEFVFWKEGKGYTPTGAFTIQAHAFRPFAIIDLSLHNAAFTGRRFRREIHVVNDLPRVVEGRLWIAIRREGRSYAEQTERLAIPRGRTVKFVLDVLLPRGLPEGEYEYHAVFFEEKGGRLDEWTRSLHLFSSILDLPVREPLLSDSIAVLGKGSLRPFLDAAQLSYRYIDKLDAKSLAKKRILILEKNTVEPGSSQNQEIRRFVREGGRVIVLEQEHTLFSSLPLVPKPVLTSFIRAPHHPVVKGFWKDALSFWGDDPFALVGGDAFVAHRMYQKNAADRALFLVESGEGSFGNGALDLTPLFEATEGKGLILACQLRVTDKLAESPAAQQLLLQMLCRASTYEPKKRQAPLLAKATDSIEALLKKAQKGATVVVEDVSATILKAWGKALGLRLRFRNGGPIYQGVRVSDDPILEGISHEDANGVQAWTYGSPELKNTIIAKNAIEPVEGLEPLIETPTESCLRELFVEGGKTEPLRAHTVSRFLFAEKPLPAVLVGRVRVGKGWVIFNQFAPGKDALPHHIRLRQRFLANLGVTTKRSLFEGDTVPSTPAASPGYPQILHVLNQDVDEALRQNLVEQTRPTAERMMPSRILGIPGWRKVEASDGTFSVQGLDLDQPIFLYSRILSPRVRKNLETDLGIPNPELLTFLDLYGEGEVRVTVNGETKEAVKMVNGLATLSDLSLELGWNQVLIEWKPEDASSTLRLQWRNIMRQPEIDLTFH